MKSFLKVIPECAYALLTHKPYTIKYPIASRLENRLSDFSTNPYSYITGTVALTSIFASAALGVTHDQVNRSIALARLARGNHSRLQAARRWQDKRRKLELELAIARCDVAIARWHLKKLEQARTQRS